MRAEALQNRTIFTQYPCLMPTSFSLGVYLFRRRKTLLTPWFKGDQTERHVCDLDPSPKCLPRKETRQLTWIGKKKKKNDQLVTSGSGGQRQRDRSGPRCRCLTHMPQSGPLKGVPSGFPEKKREAPSKKRLLVEGTFRGWCNRKLSASPV